jgi:hypothetical protein
LLLGLLWLLWLLELLGLLWLLERLGLLWLLGLLLLEHRDLSRARGSHC